MTTGTSIVPQGSGSGQSDQLTRWKKAACAQYSAARELARMIADTLRVQFKGAAYFVMEIDDHWGSRDFELFPRDIRDASGAILCDFDSAVLPPIDPSGDLRRAWGELDPCDAFHLRWLIRQMYIAGAVFDELPEDLMHEDDPEEGLPCLLLSEQARPQTWEAPEHVGERLMRPYSMARPRPDTPPSA